MDIFKLYRSFWDFCFENPDKIKPTHIAIYSFAVEHCNRLGWKKKFGLPTSMVMEATGIKSYSVYKKHLDQLVEFGFIDMIELSRNQYSANIIALKENDKASIKALDKALIKHSSKQTESTSQSIITVDKQVNNSTIKQETNKEPTKVAQSVDFNFNEYIKQINKLFDRNFKKVIPAVKTKMKATLKVYTKDNVWIAMQNCKNDTFHIENNYKYCTPKFFARLATIDKHGDKLRKSDKANNTYQLID